MATAAWAETGPRPALPWETEGDWRVSRTRLAMPTAMLRASMDWWWSSTNVLPDTPNDLVGSLRRNALELLSAIDEPAAEKLGFSKEDWWKLVAETTVSVGLDRIPFFGAGTAVVRSARQGLYMKSTDSAASALKLASELEPRTPDDLLTALAVARLAHPDPTLPAIPPLILVIENANHLSTAELEQLERILTLNPAERLASTPHLPQAAARTLKALGLPPALPITLILLEDTSAAGQPFIGPFGHQHETDQPEPTHLATWCTHISSKPNGVPLIVLDHFPLATTPEAAAIVEQALPESLNKASIVSRSLDPYLDGHNIALVRAHIQRIALLSDATDLDPEWLATNLPTHLETEVATLAQTAGLETRQGLIAASLVGFGFTRVGMTEVMGKEPSKAILDEALSLGLVSVQGGEQPLPMYVFGDHMTYQYFKSLGLADRSLARTTLETTTLPKARMALGWAYAAHSTQALKVAETAMGACWEYRDLAEGAGLSVEASRAVDVWGVALALTADRDMIFAEAGDDAARKRLAFLHQIRDQSCTNEQNIHAWACIRRWHVHRHTPGPMSYQSILSMTKTDRLTEAPTRTMPEAHQLAAELVARHLNEYPDGQALGWFDAQLLYRLGPYVRHIDSTLALQAAELLLHAGLTTATATHYLASELWHLLPPSGQRLCARQLEHWAQYGQANDPARSAALLILRGCATSTDTALNILRDAFTSKTQDNMMGDFQAHGSFGDLSAPRVYPWNGLDVLVTWALIQSSPTDAGIARGKLRHRLLALAQTHPSAVAIVESDFADELNNKQRRRIDDLGRRWRLTGLAGHSEQGPLPTLTERL